MKSVSNRGVGQSRLQMLHIHVLLVASLGTRHMAKPRTDQCQGEVPIRERPRHMGSAADLTVQPLNFIAGADNIVADGRRLLRYICKTELPQKTARVPINERRNSSLYKHRSPECPDRRCLFIYYYAATRKSSIWTSRSLLSAKRLSTLGSERPDCQ